MLDYSPEPSCAPSDLPLLLPASLQGQTGLSIPQAVTASAVIQSYYRK